jgi:hypothetical protein
MGTPFGEPMGTPRVIQAWPSKPGGPEGRVREYPKLMKRESSLTSFCHDWKFHAN